MNAPLLTAKGLAVGHGRRILMRDLDLSVGRGELVALIGINGIGKSTLLRCIAGLHGPDAGSVRVDGLDLYGTPARERARRVAVVLSGRPATAMVDVRTVVALGRQPWTGTFGTMREADARAVDEALHRAGATHLAGRDLSQLSDGEAQRVMIARALAQDTPLLLLDEPTAFLDVAGRATLLHLLRALADEGRAILFTTHDLQPAFEVCDRVLVIGRDGTTWSGTPDQAVADGVVAREFARDGLRFDPVTRTFRPA